MAKLYLCADLHMGHNNITKYRQGFSSAEEHHNIIFDNVASTVGKRDTLWLLGDIAFTKEWLFKVNEIRCHRKVLILGNHDQSRGISIKDISQVYDDVFALVSHRNYWFSHAPIHESEIRNRKACIHGHIHNELINDTRYVNVSIEHTDYKPITFQEAIERNEDYIRSFRFD